MAISLNEKKKDAPIAESMAIRFARSNAERVTVESLMLRLTVGVFAHLGLFNLRH